MSLIKNLIVTSAAVLAVPAFAQMAAPPKSDAKPSATDAPKSAADAAAAAEAGSGSSEIVVTARRVSERLIDVPLTIRALTGRELQERGINSLSDLAQFTPGLSYSPDLGRTAERPVIRGISALRPEAPQPVSVFVDGLYMRDGVLGVMLDDAQRVEVIKGPQSALYGRSTYAGAINYITVKPGNEFKGVAQATVAQAGETSIFAAVTVPLIKDVLTMRIKARDYKFGGQYTNTQTGNKIGDESTKAGGVILSYTPTGRFDARLTYDTNKDRDGLFSATARTVPTQVAGVITSQNGSTNVANGGTCNGRTINIVGNNAAGLPDANVAPTTANRLNGWPCGSSTFSGTTVTRNERDLSNYTDPATGINYGKIAGLDREINRTGLTMNFELAGYTLTGQAGWTRQKSNLGADQSYNGTQFAITGASWMSYDRDRLDYNSYELRLTSPQDQPLTWLVGVFDYDEKTSGMGSGVIARSGASVVADTLRPKSGTKTSNSAPFARLQYEIDKQWRVSVEGRQNKETVEAGVGGASLGIARVTAGTCVAGQPCVIAGTQTFKDFSPRFTVDYKPAKDTLVYGQLARGSKAGGFNLSAGLPSSDFTFKGETVESGELGVKMSMMNGNLSVNAAVFRNNIDGLQLSNLATITNPISGSIATVTIVNNVGKARTEGFEFDVWHRVNNWLQLNANYAYTDAKAIEGTEITNGTVYGGNRSVAGFVLPRTPKHSAAASAAVDTPLAGTGLRAFGRFDVVYQSRRYAEIQNMIWADPYTRINLSAGVRGKDWRATLWVKNAANDDTSLNGFRYLDAVTFRRTAVDFLPRLRQVGLTLNATF
jgi:outer membrane receptor protein involved in Fe transport